MSVDNVPALALADTKFCQDPFCGGIVLQKAVVGVLLFLVGLILILAMVVPALVFVSPILVMIFSIISWLLVLTSSVYGINAIVRGRQIGALSTKTAILLGILHLLFVADVIASIIAFVRLRKNRKKNS